MQYNPPINRSYPVRIYDQRSHYFPKIYKSRAGNSPSGLIVLSWSFSSYRSSLESQPNRGPWSREPVEFPFRNPRNSSVRAIWNSLKLIAEFPMRKQEEEFPTVIDGEHFGSFLNCSVNSSRWMPSYVFKFRNWHCSTFFLTRFWEIHLRIIKLVQ